MIEIKTKSGTLTAEGVAESKEKRGQVTRSALHITFPGGVTAEQIDQLTSGWLEIGGAVREGFTALKEVSVTVGKTESDDAIIAGLEAELVEEKVQHEKSKATLDKAVAVVRAAPDNVASTAPDLFPGLTGDGSLIQAGTRINWGGVLKKAAVDLWDTAENTPDAAPGLWVDILYRDGIRIIPETITLAEKFSAGEEGWWNNEVYVSLVNDNVYTPEQYAPNWKRKETAA